PFDAELDGQALDFEQRRTGWHSREGLFRSRRWYGHGRACACSNSRSPRTLKAITTATMQPPAASAGSGQPCGMPTWVSEIITPPLGAGGCTPSPIKEIAARSTIA